jgi:hypothetical protein
MKPDGLVAFMTDLALHLLVAGAVAFLVVAVLRVVRPMGAIERHLGARIAWASLGS